MIELIYSVYLVGLLYHAGRLLYKVNKGLLGEIINLPESDTVRMYFGDDIYFIGVAGLLTMFVIFWPITELSRLFIK